MIDVRGLTKGYQGTAVLDGLDLHVGRGELVVLLGCSGSGKTSLLRLIAGLEPPERGEIRIGGRLVSSARTRIEPFRRGVGLVFQDLALWPHLRAIDNVRFGLGPDPTSGLSPRQRAAGALDSVGIGELARRYPNQLSGGERQRLALARALAPGHPVLLMDEPFNNLDPVVKRPLFRLLGGIRDSGETGILYVTHNLDEALTLADRVVLLIDGSIRAELDHHAIETLDLGGLNRWYFQVAGS